MADRHLPVRPDLEQLRHQAKDLLRALRRGEPSALADFARHHPERAGPAGARLADAQLVLARSYGVPSWPRLVLAWRMTAAIWRDAPAAVRALGARGPRLLHEMARGTKSCNWGPPMSYAANLGRDRIISALSELGARHVEHALGRAVLQGRIETARALHALAGRPRPPWGAVMGPAESLNGDGMAFLLGLGAEICDGSGDRLAPVERGLEAHGRSPAGTHHVLTD